VLVDSTGHLGTKSSSARFKDAIKPMNKASEAILALKPVIFHYKKERSKVHPAVGLVAEDVEKVNPDLVARDAEGKVYTFRHDAVNAMSLNEFLRAPYRRGTRSGDHPAEGFHHQIVEPKSLLDALAVIRRAELLLQLKQRRFLLHKRNQQLIRFYDVAATLSTSANDPTPAVMRNGAAIATGPAGCTELASDLLPVFHGNACDWHRLVIRNAITKALHASEPK